VTTELIGGPRGSKSLLPPGAANHIARAVLRKSDRRPPRDGIGGETAVPVGNVRSAALGNHGRGVDRRRATPGPVCRDLGIRWRARCACCRPEDGRQRRPRISRRIVCRVAVVGFSSHQSAGRRGPMMQACSASLLPGSRRRHSGVSRCISIASNPALCRGRSVRNPGSAECHGTGSAGRFRRRGRTVDGAAPPRKG